MANERALLKRLVISHFDFAEMRQFINKLTGQGGEVAPDPGDRLSRMALRTAIVVAYARPFSGNRSTGDTQKQLPERLLKGLSPKHRAVHNRILARRHKEFAHSDADRVAVTISVTHNPKLPKLAIPISNVTRSELREADVQALKVILDHLDQAIAEEQIRIQALLTPGEQF